MLSDARTIEYKMDNLHIVKGGIITDDWNKMC